MQPSPEQAVIFLDAPTAPRCRRCSKNKMKWFESHSENPRFTDTKSKKCRLDGFAERLPPTPETRHCSMMSSCWRMLSAFCAFIVKLLIRCEGAADGHVCVGGDRWVRRTLTIIHHEKRNQQFPKSPPERQNFCRAATS